MLRGYLSVKVYSSFAVCLPQRSLIVNRRTHFSCTFVLAERVSEAKNLKLRPSNLPRLHLKDPKQGQSHLSELYRDVASQASSFLLWSKCWKECFHSFILFYSSSSSEAEVIYRAAVAGQQS